MLGGFLGGKREKVVVYEVLGNGRQENKEEKKKNEKNKW